MTDDDPASISKAFEDRRLLLPERTDKDIYNTYTGEGRGRHGRKIAGSCR